MEMYNFYFIYNFADSLMADIQVVCGHNQMVVQLRTLGAFHGIVYPRGLAKKTPCMEEVDVKSSQVFTHAVPLRSCNTMFTDLVRRPCPYPCPPQFCSGHVRNFAHVQ